MTITTDYNSKDWRSLLVIGIISIIVIMPIPLLFLHDIVMPALESMLIIPQKLLELDEIPITLTDKEFKSIDEGYLIMVLVLPLMAFGFIFLFLYHINIFIITKLNIKLDTTKKIIRWK